VAGKGCGRGGAAARLSPSAVARTVIRKDLLDILACPLCKAAVRLEDDWLVCTACGRRYPIREGIPAMRPEDAVLPEEVPEDRAGPLV